MDTEQRTSDSALPPRLRPPADALRGGTGIAMGAVIAAAARHAPVSESTRRQGFRVGPLRLMIAYEDGNELVEMPGLHRLPNAPVWFSGMCNLHGSLVAVFDPATRLGVARASAEKPMLLVVGHGDEKAGLIIDGLPQRLQFRAADEISGKPVPEGLAGCVSGAYWCGDEDWFDFDYAPFLDRLAAELAR